MLNKTLWTIGHSTRPLDELIKILEHYGIETLVDVRTVPRSRKNPQFNRDELEKALPEAGIEYHYANDLGGLRKPHKDSPNSAWRNDSFRGYADYMQTPEFEDALGRLIIFAEEKNTAIMCAEILPWRCHRSLIADVLTARGWDVIEIFDEKQSRPHKMTSFAVACDGRVFYPATEPCPSSI